MGINRGKKRKKNNHENSSRLNFVLAIIFLLGGGILFKLYNLQVLNYDMYVALAADQHQVFSKLAPNRGKIFIQDGQNISENELYPVATNKEYALVYAIPSRVDNAKELSNQLYDILNKEEVEEEVKEIMEDDEYYSDEEKKVLEVSTDEAREIFVSMKRDLEIESRKSKILDIYFKKLSKKNDPYEPIKRKVDKDKLEEILALNNNALNYTLETFRYYPEIKLGSQFLGFVGFNEDGQIGQYGLEGFFNEELSGKFGSIKSERSAKGDLIIINDREYNKAQDGDDLILTMNRSIQFYVCQKLREAVESHEADSGSVVVMEPKTGAILAMCSFPDYDSNNYNDIEEANVYNNPVVFESYEPGSIFKVFTIAAGIDQGKISPNTLFNDKGSVMIDGWDKPIKNSDFASKGARGMVDMNEVLEQSLNTGTIFVMKQTGDKIFADYVRKFGFGEKTGIELETEGPSNIAKLERQRIRPVEAATASFGQGITVTPLQITAAYAALANGGILMKPYLVSEIVSPNGNRYKTSPKQIRRVVSERTAMLVSGMMVNVVDGGHAKLAGVEGYYVGGKTGTAQVADREKRGYGEKTIHSFVGYAPIDEPKFVMSVKLNDPKDVDYSASSAAPLFGDLASFILNYYQVPKDR